MPLTDPTLSSTPQPSPYDQNMVAALRDILTKYQMPNPQPAQSKPALPTPSPPMANPGPSGQNPSWGAGGSSPLPTMGGGSSPLPPTAPMATPGQNPSWGAGGSSPTPNIPQSSLPPTTQPPATTPQPPATAPQPGAQTLDMMSFIRSLISKLGVGPGA
jgi:hypothetical protein